MKQSICFKSTKQQHNRERRKELILQRRQAKQLLKSEFGRFEYLTFQSSTIRSLKTENGEDPTFMFHAKIRESQQPPPPMILTMVLSPRQKGLCESQPGQSDPGKALQLLQSRITGPSDLIPICPTNKHYIPVLTFTDSFRFLLVLFWLQSLYTPKKLGKLVLLGKPFCMQTYFFDILTSENEKRKCPSSIPIQTPLGKVAP